jgi:hypothetical protein
MKQLLSSRHTTWVAAVVTVSALSGAAVLALRPDTFEITGTMRTPTCGSSTGYDDIVTGAPVTVYNAKNEVIALGELAGDPRTNGTDRCEWTFTVADVPEGERFYSVEVSHRGKVTFSADELQSGPLSLGLG